MGEDQGAVSAPVSDQPTTPAQTPDDPAALRAEIERTRQDLGETVAALAERTDVKARAKEKVAEVKQTVTHHSSELVTRARDGSPDGAASAAAQARAKAQEKPVHTAAVAAFVGGFLLGRITAR